MHYALATLISPRLSDSVGEVLGRQSRAQCLLASVSGSSQQLVQSEWERLRAHYLPAPTSHISKSL